MNFPIFHKRLEEISWEMIQYLLKIPKKKERLFYYYLSLFLQCNYDEMITMIQNHYYDRI